MTERESERESENEPGKEGGEGEQANSYHAKAYSGRTRLAMSCLCRTILQRPGLRSWMYQREHSTSSKVRQRHARVPCARMEVLHFCRSMVSSTRSRTHGNSKQFLWLMQPLVNVFNMSL